MQTTVLKELILFKQFVVENNNVGENRIESFSIKNALW